MTSAEDLSAGVRENIHHTLCLQGEENNKSRTLWCVESGGTGERRSIPVVRSTPVRPPRLRHTTERLFTGCRFYRRAVADTSVYRNLVRNRWTQTAVHAGTSSGLLPEVWIKT